MCKQGLNLTGSAILKEAVHEICVCGVLQQRLCSGSQTSDLSLSFAFERPVHAYVLKDKDLEIT